MDWLIIAYCIIVFYLSIAATNNSAALSKTNVAGLRSDYLLHVLLFIPFMVLANWRLGSGQRSKFRFCIALGAGLVFAAFSEGVQYFLPYRAFNVLDLGANWLGIVAGALVPGWKIFFAGNQSIGDKE